MPGSAEAVPAPTLNSVHTAHFRPLLAQLGVSLLVSTSQAGKLVILRADGNSVNTPGFTRGLDFCGRFAFVGLSQVRESAVFSGIAIAERPERSCGVWEFGTISDRTVAYLKFEAAVQEIFAVQVLHGRCLPDVINDNNALIADSFILPEPALADGGPSAARSGRTVPTHP